MSEFLNNLRQERASLAQAVNATELAGARAEVEDARAALQAWRTEHGEKIAARGYLEPEAIAETKLESAVEVARERVDGLERSQKQAADRAREVDSYLNAPENLAAARKAHAGAATELERLRRLEIQLDQIIASYRDEVAALTEKLHDATSRRADAEVEARIAGKSAAAAKPVASIETDLASRQDALAAAERKRDAVRASVADAFGSSSDSRAQLRTALARVAELAYYEALPKFLPVLARLMAHGSWIGGGPNIGNLFSIRCDPDLVRAAADEIECETRGDQAQKKEIT